MTGSLKNPSSTAKAPSHIAYHVLGRNEGAAIWTRIGSAWRHANGKGFSMLIDTTPLNGRISLRVPYEKSV